MNIKSEIESTSNCSTCKGKSDRVIVELYILCIFSCIILVSVTLNSVILSVRVYRGFLLLMCTFAMRLAHTFSVKQLEPFVIEINFKVARLDGLRPLAAC